MTARFTLTEKQRVEIKRLFALSQDREAPMTDEHVNLTAKYSSIILSEEYKHEIDAIKAELGK